MGLLNTIFLPFLFVSVFQTNISCSGNGNDITGISVVYHIPIVNYDSSIVNKESSYEKFLFHDLMMYRYYYSFDSSENGKLILNEKRYYYFVFHKDSAMGRVYSPNPGYALSGDLFPVDSIVKKNRIYNDRVDILADRTPDSVYYLDNGDKIKLYKPVPDTAQPEPYTLRFYYTKGMKGVNEQLSAKMDNEPGLKLYRISIASDGWYYERYKMKFPAREYLMEIKELAPEKNPEVLNYFKKYINNQQR